MRVVLVLVAVLALGLASVAWAGDWHVSGTLVCSDCHVAHYSQQHSLFGSGLVGVTPLGGSGPYALLLRNDPNLLCLSCHNNNTIAPDVFGDNNGKLGSPDRSAGALNSGSVFLGNDPGYGDFDGHTLWSTAAAPGGTWNHATIGLECVDCHSAHGSATQFRNLRTSTRSTSNFYNKFLTYVPGGGNIATRDVWLKNIHEYNTDDVAYNEPVTTASAYGNWCAACHTVFHGSSLSTDMMVGGSWVRHPTADVNLTSSRLRQYLTGTSDSTGTRANRVRVMDSNGLWGVGSANMTPSCFSCHKSHGNKNGFGLIFMAGNGSTVTEEGDGGAYRDLCRQCHTQGA